MYDLWQVTLSLCASVSYLENGYKKSADGVMRIKGVNACETLTMGFSIILIYLSCDLAFLWMCLENVTHITLIHFVCTAFPLEKRGPSTAEGQTACKMKPN